jgi:hypothetical protein
MFTPFEPPKPIQIRAWKRFFGSTGTTPTNMTNYPYILGIPFDYAERSFVARGVQCQSRQLIGLSQIAEAYPFH